MQFVFSIMNATGSGDEVHTPNNRAERVVIYVGISTAVTTGLVLLLVVLYRCHKAKHPGAASPRPQPCEQALRTHSSSSGSSDDGYYSLSSAPNSGRNDKVSKEKDHQWLPVVKGLTRCISEGAYGQVYVNPSTEAQYYALKLFRAHVNKEWEKEVHIFGIINQFENENLVHMVWSDVLDTGGLTRCYILMDYHRLGSIRDYGQAQNFTLLQVTNVIHGIASALDFLQAGQEVSGMAYRIAHRDIKSTNILVKDDYSACLIDFGTAMTDAMYSASIRGKHHCVVRRIVGTPRYIAPEQLRSVGHGMETFECQRFSELLGADMYAASLVMWELLTSALGWEQCDGGALELSVWSDCRMRKPYWREVPPSPTLQDMQICLLDRHTYPEIFAHWTLYPELQPLLVLMEKCWQHTPGRPTARELLLVSTCAHLDTKLGPNLSLSPSKESSEAESLS
ncbi:activin receptor type-1-like [Sycon ciliatum]|uniref:activin receptor type-1-like n=1 Tax=Sycon ciliatum TaxID=27933 RepID=UPI0031F674CA